MRSPSLDGRGGYGNEEAAADDGLVGDVGSAAAMMLDKPSIENCWICALSFYLRDNAAYQLHWQSVPHSEK
jgi:hypothetical protein